MDNVQKKQKIILYGSCSFAYFYRELIRVANEKKTPIEWRVIVRTWRHLPLYEGIVPKEHLFYVPERVNAYMKEPMADLSLFHEAVRSIEREIAADKNTPGDLRRRPRTYQLQNAAAYYRAYKEYLSAERPDYVFFPTVETHEGMILYSVAKELGIATIFRTSSRNLDVCFFSETPYEDIPSYTFTEPMNAALVEKATRIVDDFVVHPLTAWRFLYNPPPEDLIPFKIWTPISNKLARAPIALWNLFKDWQLEPHVARPSNAWMAPRMLIWPLLKKLWRFRGKFRKRFFDIHSVDQLPKRFIYFPLHVYPELSVTTLAPYFEDPLRAIDLILLNMPSDHYLVVKEHPVMRGRRPTAFYKALRQRAGVLLVDGDMPGIDLVKRAALTVAITGTSAAEALLCHRPSIMLAPVFIAPFVGNLVTLDTFDKTLRDTMGQDTATVRRKAIDCVSHILSAGYDFVLDDPHNADSDPKYTMNCRNLNHFMDALQDHIRRIENKPQ